MSAYRAADGGILDTVSDINPWGGPELSPIASEILVWCGDDFTELFGIRAVVARRMAVEDPAREKQVALSALQELTALNLLSVRDEADAEAPTWGESAQEIRARLNAAWDSSAANMGVGPWLCATDFGLAIESRRQASVPFDPGPDK